MWNGVGAGCAQVGNLRTTEAAGGKRGKGVFVQVFAAEISLCSLPT